MILWSEINPNGHPIPPEYIENAFRLYYVSNVIRARFGNPIWVSRGVSTPSEQELINPGVTGSSHPTFQAVDLVTQGNSQPLWNFLMDNFEEFVMGLDIYLEDKRFTPKHVHLQVKPVPSGKRIFIP